MLLNMGQPDLFFVYVRSFQQFCRKIVDFYGIQTRIIWIEGELVDDLATTTAQSNKIP